jgi:flagellar basal-body rod protein FlgG
MERGLYIAASGMLAETVRQDQIANDLANSSTPGYKADRASQKSFGQLLLANSLTGQPVGSLGLGVQIGRTVTDLSSGPIRETGEPLDFAIEGTGFFGIQTANGVRYTRNGQFSVSANGTLVTAQGDQVLGQNGAPIRVDAKGRVSARAVGTFEVPGARKVGDGLFSGTAAGKAAGSVRGGALEGSGVDAARSMVDMIASFRAFESGQKVIRTIDETLERAAGQVGSINGQ